jgi:hypothetical protein
VALGETLVEPVVDSFPLHPLLAEQLLAPVDDQLRTEDAPETMLVELAVSVTVGADELPPPPPPPHAARTATQSPETVERASDMRLSPRTAFILF